MAEPLIASVAQDTRRGSGDRPRSQRPRRGGRPPRLDRRQFIGVAGLAFVALAARPALPARGQVKLTDPGEYASANGVLKATLTVTRQAVPIGGAPVVATVYNGSFVGPTLRVRPGDHIELDLVNKLDEPTNLHFHGMHVSPAGIADNIFLRVDPGATQRYVVDIPTNHPVGTFWYHSHQHHLSEAQVFGGLSGLVVVEGLNDLLPPALRDIPERVIALKDFQAKDGAILTQNIDSNAPTTRTVNSDVNPSLTIDAGETQLWRLANIGADIYYEVQLAGHPFHVLAEDGNPVWRVDSADSLVLPPGKRFDVLVQGGAPGTYAFKTLAYDQQGDQYPEATLATVAVNPSSRVAATIPSQMVAPYDLSSATVDNRRTVTFAKDQAHGMFTIDGKVFEAGRIDAQVKLGALEEWRIVNQDKQQHPFHIHVNAFQVMSIDGEPYDAVGRADSVNLPKFGEVVIRIPFLDFTGTSVYHCHILNHEDMGMMATFEVTA